MADFYKKNDIEVNWTGSYPNLCSGHWIIKINSIELIDKANIPDSYESKYQREKKYKYNSFMTENMETAKEYSRWHFDENNSEVFEYYNDGLKYSDWIKSEYGNNILTLLGNNSIYLSEEDLENLYNKIKEKDWRSSSCGGCI
jgi:hypothetical protein